MYTQDSMIEVILLSYLEEGADEQAAAINIKLIFV